MRLAVAIVVAGLALVACSPEKPAVRSEEAFLADTLGVRGTAQARLVLGELICTQMETTEPEVLAASLTGELYDVDEATTLVTAAGEHLCP